MSEGVRIAVVAGAIGVIACIASALYVAPQNRQAAALNRIADSIDKVEHAIRVQTKEHYAMFDNLLRQRASRCERCERQATK